MTVDKVEIQADGTRYGEPQPPLDLHPIATRVVVRAATSYGSATGIGSSLPEAIAALLRSYHARVAAHHGG